MAILKNDDDVCDALQDTLLSAYKNLGSLQNREYFSTWITRILINKCYDIIRKNQKVVYLNQKLEVQEDSYYQMYSQESDLERILNIIDNDLKTVTVLYYYDDLSVNEISQILNIPEGTVKSRLSRARDKIFKVLKEEEGEFNG
jgi:RNA polymerase sigma-70 factor (ECF subfamily)